MSEDESTQDLAQDLADLLRVAGNPAATAQNLWKQIAKEYFSGCAANRRMICTGINADGEVVPLGHAEEVMEMRANFYLWHSIRQREGLSQTAMDEILNQYREWKAR